MRKLREFAFNVWDASRDLVLRIQMPIDSGGGHMSGIGDGIMNMILLPVTVPLSSPLWLLEKVAKKFVVFQDTLVCFHPDHVKGERPLVLAVKDYKGRLRLPAIPGGFDQAKEAIAVLESIGVRDCRMARLGLSDMFDGVLGSGTVYVLVQGKIRPVNGDVRWVGWDELTRLENAYAAFHATIQEAWEVATPGKFAWLAELVRVPYDVTVEGGV